MTAARAIRAWLLAAETPSDLPRWSPTWAGDIARDAERLRAQGMPAEDAWWQAAALHRPAGVPEPLRHERQAQPPPPPAPPTGAALVVLEYLRTQRRPCTVAEISAGTGLSKHGVQNSLPKVARKFGARKVTRRNRAVTWRAR